jgi:hypothetical protein
VLVGWPALWLVLFHACVRGVALGLVLLSLIPARCALPGSPGGVRWVGWVERETY